MSDPAPIPNAPGRKVTFASLATYIGFTILVFIGQLLTNQQANIAGLLHGYWAVFVGPVIPAVIAYITGWITLHAPKDLSLPMKNGRRR